VPEVSRRPARHLLVGDHRVVQTVPYDYKLPNSQAHSGVVFFHWRRLLDRLYSQSWIEATKDPQRQINNLVTSKAEIIARGGPKVLVEEPLPETPTGVPMEQVVIGKQKSPPIFHAGVGPGDWMNVEKAGWIDDLAHAATLSQIQLG
jgi:hypothetical protein